MKMLRRLVSFLLMGGAFVVAYQFGKNVDPVAVRLFGWTTPSAPLWVALALAFAGGVVLASALWLFQVMRLSLLGRRYRKELAALEGELHRLRNLPLQPGAETALMAPVAADPAAASHGPRG